MRPIQIKQLFSAPTPIGILIVLARGSNGIGGANFVRDFDHRRAK
jgi:hypothetical protein